MKSIYAGWAWYGRFDMDRHDLVNFASYAKYFEEKKRERNYKSFLKEIRKKRESNFKN